MLKALTAYTDEIDDVEAAVSKILEQVREEDLLGNSVGLLTCNSDFIESGVVKALCSALPFEVVGSTTLGNSVPGTAGTMLLTLLVLTGDDVSFAVGLTEAFSSEDANLLHTAYQVARAKMERPHSLMLSFAPLLVNAGGDFYVNTFSAVSGGVLDFGMLSVGHTLD